MKIGVRAVNRTFNILDSGRYSTLQPGFAAAMNSLLSD